MNRRHLLAFSCIYCSLCSRPRASSQSVLWQSLFVLASPRHRLFSARRVAAQLRRYQVVLYCVCVCVCVCVCMCVKHSVWLMTAPPHRPPIIRLILFSKVDLLEALILSLCNNVHSEINPEPSHLHPRRFVPLFINTSCCPFFYYTAQFQRSVGRIWWNSKEKCHFFPFIGSRFLNS